MANQTFLDNLVGLPALWQRIVSCVRRNSMYYGQCLTLAATAAKEVTCDDFVLSTGVKIAVNFKYTNTKASPTLNVSSTGAKPIYYKGTAITASYLQKEKTYLFIYNGTQYELVGDIDTNDTYTAATTTKQGLMSIADKKKLDATPTIEVVSALPATPDANTIYFVTEET